MEEKLRRLMKHEGINSTKLAEILGIQASGISHIMSGRNKPSYDFLVKLLQRFPQINPDWLLIDKGPMYRDEIKKGATSATAEKSQPSGISQHAPGQGGTVQVTGSASASGGVSAGLFSGQTGGGGFYGENLGSGEGGNFGERQNGGGEEINLGNGGQTVGASSYGAELGIGPDNNDIIPTGRHAGNQVENLSGSQATTARDAYGKMPYNYGQASSPFPSPAPFARTASIERIVVFYKDKTFSEYQPE